MPGQERGSVEDMISLESLHETGSAVQPTKAPAYIRCPRVRSSDSPPANALFHNLRETSWGGVRNEISILGGDIAIY